MSLSQQKQLRPCVKQGSIFKVVPVYATKAYGGSGRAAPLTLSSALNEAEDHPQFPSVLHAGKKPPEASGSHSRSVRFGRHMNALVLPDIELLNVNCAGYNLVTTLTELSWLPKLNLHESQGIYPKPSSTFRVDTRTERRMNTTNTAIRRDRALNVPGSGRDQSSTCSGFHTEDLTSCEDPLASFGKRTTESSCALLTSRWFFSLCSLLSSFPPFSVSHSVLIFSLRHN